MVISHCLATDCPAWALRRLQHEYWSIQLPFHLSAVTDGRWSLILSVSVCPSARAVCIPWKQRQNRTGVSACSSSCLRKTRDDCCLSSQLRSLWSTASGPRGGSGARSSLSKVGDVQQGTWWWLWMCLNSASHTFKHEYRSSLSPTLSNWS